MGASLEATYKHLAAAGWMKPLLLWTALMREPSHVGCTVIAAWHGEDGYRCSGDVCCGGHGDRRGARSG
jgi:hypothetical protein